MYLSFFKVLYAIILKFSNIKIWRHAAKNVQFAGRCPRVSSIELSHTSFFFYFTSIKYLPTFICLCSYLHKYNKYRKKGKTTAYILRQCLVMVIKNDFSFHYFSSSFLVNVTLNVPYISNVYLYSIIHSYEGFIYLYLCGRQNLMYIFN